MKNSHKLLIALGTGIAIGGLLGVLFAPHKGSKTRRRISEEGRKIVDQFKDTVDDCLEKCHVNGSKTSVQRESSEEVRQS
ncbi:MAG: YtxH domain-containing protein [Saprospiraceae bacterium]